MYFVVQIYKGEIENHSKDSKLLYDRKFSARTAHHVPITPVTEHEITISSFKLIPTVIISPVLPKTDVQISAEKGFNS